MAINPRYHQLAEELRSVVQELRDSVNSSATDVIYQQLKTVSNSIRQFEAQDILVPQELRNLETSLSAQVADRTKWDEAVLFLLSAIRPVYRDLRGITRSRRAENESGLNVRKRRRVRPTVLAPGQITWSVPTGYHLFGSQLRPVQTWREILIGTAERLLQDSQENGPSGILVDTPRAVKLSWCRTNNFISRFWD